MLNWAYPDFVAVGLFFFVSLLLMGFYWRRGWRIGRALGQRAGRLGWKTPLRLLAGAGLGLALLGPSWGVSQQPVRAVGKDVWLLVDVSRSMDATDVTPSRLLRAQAELQQLVAQFPADRLGLILFGGEAVVQCPLTHDQEALRVFLGTLRTSLLPPGATTLRTPLDMVLDKLTRSSPASNAARTTAVVVVSDGEDFGENLEPTLHALARTGTRVYAVGVGTAAGARIPKPGGGLVRDQRNEPVTSRLQDATLLQLAAQTGGQYVELNDKQNGVSRLTAALRNLQGPTAQIRSVAVADNRYRWPLALALLLLALDAVVTIRVIRP
ncbi:VWA domain-containing protein [Hymenobacter sp. ASUV-10]|uniref:VWA domain-containing protein n=1 Tax=Hymenobacter aranciens TaxID=3063996 RepID=A0ABT9BHF6_9BACT|nr:VWA domain-containing protein [Hymenobacter sp. ASUV-10]MDO7877685.1 VWA domain-containing protein [Hymenobacter sp. ASUV-10]